MLLSAIFTSNAFRYIVSKLLRSFLCCLCPCCVGRDEELIRVFPFSRARARFSRVQPEMDTSQAARGRATGRQVNMGRAPAGQRRPGGPQGGPPQQRGRNNNGGPNPPQQP